MKYQKFIFLTCFILLINMLCIPAALFGATVGSDGGITLTIAYGGDLDTSVTDLDPLGPGTVWATGRDMLKDRIQKFAEHIWTITEGTHYLRRVIVVDDNAAGSQRAWNHCDIRWNNGAGISEAPIDGWKNPNAPSSLNNSLRNSIADIMIHEFGHYFYGIIDEYVNTKHPYYMGSFPGVDANGDGRDDEFEVDVTTRCPNSVMAQSNYNMFCDDNNHSVIIQYNDPVTGNSETPTLTPALLSDGNNSNDGPICSNWTQERFALDEWAKVAKKHVALAGVHTSGVYPPVNLASMPAPEYLEVDDIVTPGRILLLDRSGSMGVEIDGRDAVDYVQETGSYLYYSSETNDLIGVYAYNANVESVYNYDAYTGKNILGTFYKAEGLTDIHKVLESAIDTLVAKHGENGCTGATIFLMSDGNQTTGDDLWIQVNRAKDKGIKIYTLSYGSADLPEMQQIADTTSADTIMLSEKESPNSLKRAIIKEIAKEDGLAELYSLYRKFSASGVDAYGYEYQEFTFKVPAECADLLFYVIPKKVSISDFTYSVRDSVGNMVYSSWSDVQNQGRFKGNTIVDPASGEYTVRITIPPIEIPAENDPDNPKTPAAIYRLPDDEIQILALAKNRNLNANAWLNSNIINAYDKDSFTLYASVFNKYPLSYAYVTAYFYRPDGTYITSITMEDNDEDGIYKANVKNSLFANNNISKTDIRVRFNVNHNTIPAPNALWENPADYEDIVNNFVTEEYTLWAETSAKFAYQKDDAYVPQIDLTNFGPTTLSPCTTYTKTIFLKNVYLNPSDLIINLGRDVKINQVVANRQATGTNYVITLTTACTGGGPVQVTVDVQLPNGDIVTDKVAPKPTPTGGLFATENIWVCDRSTIKGAIWANMRVETGCDSVVTGNVYSCGDAMLRERATVNGQVIVSGAVTQQNNVNVTGGIQQGVSMQPGTIASKTVSFGTRDVYVYNNASVRITPGNFQNIAVSPNCTLVLAAGVYNMKTFELYADANLKLEGPVTLNVNERVGFGDRVKYSGVSKPADLEIYTNQQSQVRVGVETAFMGNITAPFGEVCINRSPVCTCKIKAKNIRLEASVNVNAQ